ncbi:hypothetical protein ACWPM1_01735 [Tsuneonella sp. HG249]
MSAIDQTQNFKADFGLVFRSSAIFALFEDVDVTLCILNYWKIKNSLDVSLVATSRSTKGEVVARELLEFRGDIIDYRPPIKDGSVEIEAFGNRNLRIPYAAVMALYRTSHSISMVHSYARNHSWSELENDYAILDAREACIGLRAAEAVETRVYFHNGAVPIGPQKGTVIITNAAGEELHRQIEMASIQPFETVCFRLAELVPDFRRHLGHDDGWCAFHFENHSAFPRMLVRWHDARSGEMQVTHSNFDYSEHQTNMLSADTDAVIMAAPGLEREVGHSEIVVYPRCTRGRYSIRTRDGVVETAGGAVLQMEAAHSGCMTIEREDGPMPSRLVTAIRGAAPGQQVPFECSVGIIHSERPPKRFHWAMVSGEFASAVILQECSRLYGDPGRVDLVFNLYGQGGENASQTLAFECLEDVPAELLLHEIFPDAARVLDNKLGYVTMFCEWGGFLMLTSMKFQHTLTLEHAF